MVFDVFYPMKTKDGKLVPGVNPSPMEWSEIKQRVCGDPGVRDLITRHRAGDPDAKIQLPSVCFLGRCQNGYRMAKNMVPTQLVMIDVDHPRMPAKDIWESIRTEANERFGDGWVVDNVMIVHETPSHGLHIFFVAQPQFTTTKDNMDWFNGLFRLERFGDYDPKVTNFDRVSFAPVPEEIYFENTRLYLNTEVELAQNLENTAGAKSARGTKSAECPVFTKEDEEVYKNYKYRGTLVSTIVDKYIELNGTPYDHEVHNYYNELVKNFRNLVDNSREALLYLLPRFDHTAEECWSQICSICRSNTISRHKTDFYYFLKDNGFYKDRPDAKSKQGDLQEYMMAESTDEWKDAPFLPPVFKELVRIVPRDFVPAAINALLPIIGTLTSYAKAFDKDDQKWHTTSFFSIIYAPAGTGKSFVEMYLELLFKHLKLRDAVQAARENLYLSLVSRKGANEKAPDQPHTSVRIIPAKCSEAEFLGKQQDNRGYHMFTYCAEMDAWAKGSRAAGGNKDDMIRIAWDNGEYGQQYKAAGTTRGMTRLYWNVLIAGTLQQLLNYFRDVENGLVTRCSFTTIENQQYAPKPVFKSLNQREIARISRFIDRCDGRSYDEPCDITPDDWMDIKDEKAFDQKINWHFKLRPRTEYDLSWALPTLKAFQEKHRMQASKEVDEARDVFRRRVGVRGFRLALICMCLYEKPNKRDLENCCKFISWWMEMDLKSSLELWGAKYNEMANKRDATNCKHHSVFDALKKQFTKEDVMTLCMKLGVKTPVRNIVSPWNKLGLIKRIEKNKWEKL